MTRTKTINLSDDVLNIIASMEWRYRGNTVVGELACGQLDRSLYEAVDKALKALGGKWNRSAGGHVFMVDPRPQVYDTLASGTLTVERDGYFPTPPYIGRWMAETAWIKHGMVVLEPSAGTGELARAILDVAPDITLVCGEKNAQRVEILKREGFDARQWDFLSDCTVHYPRIIQNPPFEQLQDVDHVRHAFDCLEPGGILVSVMSESAFFRSDRKAVEFREWLDGLDHNFIYLGPGAFASSGTGVRARIVKIVKAAPSWQ